MQNPFKRAKSFAEPANAVEPAAIHSQPAKEIYTTTVAQMRRNLTHEGINALFVEIVYHKVNEMYGRQLAGTQKELLHTILSVVKFALKERDDINLESLQEQERGTSQRAFCDTVVLKVVEACGYSQQTHSTLQNDSVSSRMTQYSDPFKTAYNAPNGYSLSSYEPTMASLAVFNSIQKDVEANEISEDTLRAHSRVVPLSHPEIPGVRLVPKSQSSPPTNEAYPRLAAASTPSHNQVQAEGSRYNVPVQSTSGYTLMPFVQGSTLASQSIFGCDEFGRLYG